MRIEATILRLGMFRMEPFADLLDAMLGHVDHQQDLARRDGRCERQWARVIQDAKIKAN